MSTLCIFTDPVSHEAVHPGVTRDMVAEYNNLEKDAGRCSLRGQMHAYKDKIKPQTIIHIN